MPRFAAVLLALALLSVPAGARGGGGCFPAGTVVTLEGGGRQAIEAVIPGDRVVAVLPSGETTIAEVHKTYVTTATELVRFENVLATPDHPFRLDNGEFALLGSIRGGERILRPGLVYNISTSWPNTFLANGFAVHNKGGGCFPAGTRILTPTGMRAIETLSSGELVISHEGTPACVRSIERTRDELVRVITGRGILVTTASHPLLRSDGSFVSAGELDYGARVVRDGRDVRILGVERTGRISEVYNLRVDEPHTFIAEGFSVHNKGGGCFPGGVMIATPGGDRAIESISPGAEIISGDGNVTRVKKISVSFDEIFEIRTDRGILRTTREHPLLTENGFAEASSLVAGGSVQCADGTPARIEALLATGQRALVYEISADAPHSFIADGFVVHNKGGGGSRSSRGGGGKNAPPGVVIVFMIIFVVTIIAMIAASPKSKGGTELDYCYPKNKVLAKSAKANRLLETLAKTYPEFASENLVSIARTAFLRLQEVWASRDYTTMKPLVFSTLAGEHEAQITSMIRNHEINMMWDLKVEMIEIVHLRFPEKKNDRQFTALIQASTCDQYIDDRTRKFLRGDTASATFQEFWTFQFQDGNWLLREIEQTQESSALTDENFVEFLTPEQLKAAYGETVGGEGVAGPKLEKALAGKDDRIHRMLNFLAQTDKIWNEDTMNALVRSAAISFSTAMEGDLAGLKEVSTAEFVALIGERLAKQSELKETIAYRNLCVRKVDLVQIRNKTDRHGDEFIARAAMHAQIIARRGDALIFKDDDVRAWELLMRFARVNGRFCLAEIIPPTRKDSLIAAENIDDDWSPQMLEWFYSKDRAM